ncbi:hypothetical protein FXB40_01590 [Bradyrhizobium rifense]|uniref:Uncharacterized protein n=1 Tax=Bradyrhizobium rifense TaxID=515499 RepID=A0A5D3KR02_9BRAD|nr:hypothetical protein FXB40_01590 [Bradyrhizobium rifense]
MPGLVPGIHVLCAAREGVDGRNKPGHDAVRRQCPPQENRDGRRPSAAPGCNRSTTALPLPSGCRRTAPTAARRSASSACRC